MIKAILLNFYGYFVKIRFIYYDIGQNLISPLPTVKESMCHTLHPHHKYGGNF